MSDLVLPRVAIVLALAGCGAQPAPATAPTRVTTVTVVAPPEPPPPPSPERRLPAATGTGAIHGDVTDATTGKKVMGVTVVATSPALDQARALITNNDGAYTIADLPAGEYLVTFYYADLTLSRRGVIVRNGETALVFQTLDPNAHSGAVIMVPDTRLRPQP